MKRVAAEGATPDNYFTDGNPQTAVPATVLNSDYMNILQEEIAAVIESAGMELDQLKLFQDPATPHDVTQLLKAIKIHASGEYAQQVFTLLNNQSVFQNVTGLNLDKAKYKSAKYAVDIHLKTDTEERSAMGELTIITLPGANTCKAFLNLDGDDMEVVIDVSNTGQVQYKTPNISGSNFTGKLRYSPIRMMRI